MLAHVSPQPIEAQALGAYIFQARGCQIPGMGTAHEIRHKNLTALVEEFGSIQALSDKVKRPHAQISQLYHQLPHSKTGRARIIGSKLARSIEQMCGKPEGWMDVEQHEFDGQAGDLAEWFSALKDPGRRKRAYAICRFILTAEEEPVVKIVPADASQTPATSEQPAHHS